MAETQPAPRNGVGKASQYGATLSQRSPMSVAKITEVSASSTVSFEDALKQGIARAHKTLKNVEGAWIQEQKVVVRDGGIVEYRVNMKITFVLED
jgi:flavin-binding protein dodecin